VNYGDNVRRPIDVPPSCLGTAVLANAPARDAWSPRRECPDSIGAPRAGRTGHNRARREPCDGEGSRHHRSSAAPKLRLLARVIRRRIRGHDCCGRIVRGGEQVLFQVQRHCAPKKIDTGGNGPLLWANWWSLSRTASQLIAPFFNRPNRHVGQSHSTPYARPPCVGYGICS
jgi:hypothetical protein